jgi:hypothetical protein
MIVINGSTAVTYFRMAKVLLGMDKIERRFPKGFVCRGLKFSLAAKDDLARAGISYRGRPITRRSRIPLDELIGLYGTLVEQYHRDNQNVLRENITDY